MYPTGKERKKECIIAKEGHIELGCGKLTKGRIQVQKYSMNSLQIYQEKSGTIIMS